MPVGIERGAVIAHCLYLRLESGQAYADTEGGNQFPRFRGIETCLRVSMAHPRLPSLVKGQCWK
jgi:hypothetical protein